jgi:transposase
MRDNDGRKLDHTTLEQLRIRAVQQIQAGAHPHAIAQALGLARSTVFAWVAKYREGGLDALRARPVPGRPPKLEGTQLQRLYGLIVGTDPRQLGFRFALWTRAMVAELIGRQFGAPTSSPSSDTSGCSSSPRPTLKRSTPSLPPAAAGGARASSPRPSRTCMP